MALQFPVELKRVLMDSIEILDTELFYSRNVTEVIEKKQEKLTF
jgi:hypothetical protein